MVQRFAFLLAALLAATSCSEPNPTAANDLLVEPIQIESVDVSVLESSPPQAIAHVRGVLGDGCSELHSLRQERSGSTVTITISRQRPRDAICIQIARLYDENVPLTGQYPPGRYALHVNDVVSIFTTQ